MDREPEVCRLGHHIGNTGKEVDREKASPVISDFKDDMLLEEVTVLPSVTMGTMEGGNGPDCPRERDHKGKIQVKTGREAVVHSAHHRRMCRGIR